MSRLVMLAYVPTLLVAALGVVAVVCKRADIRQAQAEQRRVDRQFARIVATTLADVDGERP